MPSLIVPSSTYPWSNGTLDHVREVADKLELGLFEHEADEHTLGLWHLHNEVWTDASGHGLTLTPVGSPVLCEDGAYFDGSNYAYCTLDVRPYSALTVEAWFRVASPQEPGARIVAQNYNVTLTFGPSGRLQCSLRGVAVGGGSVSLSSASGLVTAGSWHHAAVTFQRNAVGGVKLWYDGQVVASADTADAPLSDDASTRFSVAARSNIERMTGTVDEVRVSDVVRDVSKPKRRMASGTYTSETFDSGVNDTGWTLPSVLTTLLGNNRAVAYVRAGNTSPLSGDWTLYAGATASGRYFQFKLILYRDAA